MPTTLQRWQTPVVLVALLATLFLAVGSIVEGEWMRAGELGLIALGWWWSNARDRSIAGRLSPGVVRGTGTVLLVGAVVAVVANVQDGAWLRVGAWTLLGLGVALTAWVDGRASARPVPATGA